MSLKEIKARIASVKNTRKITSAMEMVSTVKLRKAQQSALSSVPYVRQINKILIHLMAMPQSESNSLLLERDGGKTVIVAFASDSTLCGGFNANMIRHMNHIFSEKNQYGEKTDKIIIPVGKKMADAVKKIFPNFNSDYVDMILKRNYADSASMCDYLVSLFRNGTANRVILTYTHFESIGTQHIIEEQLLPIQIEKQSYSEEHADYILEPSTADLLDNLLPRVLRMKVYSAVLDSFASEEAARVIAMQSATENADNIICDLTQQYNKQRQHAITSEILDLASGAVEF